MIYFIQKEREYLVLVLLGSCKEMESSSSNTSRDAGVTDLFREVDSSFAIGYADLVYIRREAVLLTEIFIKYKEVVSPINIRVVLL